MHGEKPGTHSAPVHAEGSGSAPRLPQSSPADQYARERQKCGMYIRSLFIPHPKAAKLNAAFGDPVTFGTNNDPMVGKAVGGVVVFGGGLAVQPQGPDSRWTRR